MTYEGCWLVIWLPPWSSGKWSPEVVTPRLCPVTTFPEGGVSKFVIFSHFQLFKCDSDFAPAAIRNPRELPTRRSSSIFQHIFHFLDKNWFDFLHLIHLRKSQEFKKLQEPNILPAAGTTHAVNDGVPLVSSPPIWPTPTWRPAPMPRGRGLRADTGQATTLVS